jgi:hypothetical protein
MIKFSDFNIKPPEGAFEGKKINMEELFNVPIIIRDFKIEESKFQGKNRSNKRLQLAITISGVNYITFTGSELLMKTIQMVPKEGFPFETIIKKREKRFEFT